MGDLRQRAMPYCLRYLVGLDPTPQYIFVKHKNGESWNLAWHRCRHSFTQRTRWDRIPDIRIRNDMLSHRNRHCRRDRGTR